MALNSEDFPAFGNPTWGDKDKEKSVHCICGVQKQYANVLFIHKQLFLTSPAWAMVRSSRWRDLSWPSVPGVAVIGARFSLERKNLFPFPPAPPYTARYSWPCSERSTTVFPCSFTTVPKGTFTNRITSQIRLGSRLKTWDKLKDSQQNENVLEDCSGVKGPVSVWL